MITVFVKQGKERTIVFSKDVPKDTADSIGVNFCAIDKIKMELQVNLILINMKHVCIVAMTSQEFELQIQEVGLELSDRIQSLDSKSVENQETIDKLEEELKVHTRYVAVWYVAILIIVNRTKNLSCQIIK